MLNLVANGFNDKMANVKMFIKPDKWPEETAQQKAPRAIQFRSKEFNLALGSYLKPLEHKAYESIKWDGTRVIMKGLDQEARADVFLKKVATFEDPVFVCIDHSKFDSTITQLHLKQTHKIYRRVCGKSVQKYLKYQLRNRCWTKSGIKYTTNGTRCSGDFDTGLGNTLVNIACILQVCSTLPKFNFILDGDDAVLIIEREHRHMFSMEGFKSFGFSTKASIFDDISQVEFCQARLVDCNPWKFVRNPLRAISNQTVIHKPYSMGLMARYLAGVGLGELSVSNGVPIMQRQGQRLAESSDIPYFTEDDIWRMQMLGTKPHVRPITAAARVTFANAWGLSEGLQMAIEQTLPPLMLSYILKRKPAFKYDHEQLYGSWTRMATMGIASGSGCEQFGGGGLTGLLQEADLSTTASDATATGSVPTPPPAS